MAEHVGRIPLVRSRRRKPPSPPEMVAIILFALTALMAVVNAIALPQEHDLFWRAWEAVVAVVNALQARFWWAPIAIPALKRWWWGE